MNLDRLSAMDLADQALEAVSESIEELRRNRPYAPTIAVNLLRAEELLEELRRRPI